MNAITIPLSEEVRGQRVMLDSDLARRYGVRTAALNQAVQRNARRFPEDFAYQLTQQEFTGLMSQTVISKPEPGTGGLMSRTVLLTKSTRTGEAPRE